MVAVVFGARVRDNPEDLFEFRQTFGIMVQCEGQDQDLIGLKRMDLRKEE
jgi:hypothetical protein